MLTCDASSVPWPRFTRFGRELAGFVGSSPSRAPKYIACMGVDAWVNWPRVRHCDRAAITARSSRGETRCPACRTVSSS